MDFVLNNENFPDTARALLRLRILRLEFETRLRPSDNRTFSCSTAEGLFARMGNRYLRRK